MDIYKKLREKLTLLGVHDRSEDYLSVKVREGASEGDVAAIVQALATISNFFGVRLDQGGGGSGGKPRGRIRLQTRGILPKPGVEPEPRIRRM